MTEYTRVTVQGEGRKADLVLPDDEPIAAVLPEVLSLLDETTERSARPVVLMTTVGEQLSPALTLAEQSIEHGTILRVVRVDEAPPPPEVADVTDHMADAVETRADRWRAVWGTTAATVVAGIAGVVGTPAAVLAGASGVQVIGVLALALVLAVVVARRVRREPAVVLVGAVIGALASVAAVVVAEFQLVEPGATAMVWFGLASAVLALVGISAFSDRALALGGAVGALLVTAWVVMDALAMQPLHVAAAVAIAGVLLLGLLPGVAMAASGLTGLDDRVVEGTRVSRQSVGRAVDTTHRALTWATIAAVVPVGVAAWSLARAEEPAARLLALAVGVILLMRTQVLPLAPQRLALIAGGAVPLLTLAFAALMTPLQAAVAAIGLALALSVLVGIHTSDHTRARLRRLANIVEMVAVLSLLPLMLWLFGVFADLVRTFVR